MADMAPALLNPRIGSQWRAGSPSENEPRKIEEGADVVIETRRSVRADRETEDATRG